MNKELLHKMNFLYEIGFKPDMWTTKLDHEHHGELSGRVLSKSKWEKFTDDVVHFDHPYFTADWCWKILPKKLLDKRGEYELMIEATSDSCFVNYSRYYSHHDQLCCDVFMRNYEKQASIFSTSLHEALLEMVCWCIDNGFLKAEKCEKSN